MPYFSRGGRTHKILARLSCGPTGVGQLGGALGYERMTYRQYKRLWRKLDQLLDLGLIESSKPYFFITRAGLERLAILDRENPAEGTSVRVFGRAA